MSDVQDSSASATDMDQALAEAQDALLRKTAPETVVGKLDWSGGRTQLLKLGDGPPLLLVHGGLGDAFALAPILEPLSHTHRVMAVDLPGHGLADPFDYRGVDLLDLARRFLNEVLDAIGSDSVAIVAHSVGDKWKRLGVPTDLAWGDEDKFLSPYAATQLVDVNAYIRLHRIPDAGHLAWVDQPERVVTEIERSHGTVPG